MHWEKKPFKFRCGVISLLVVTTVTFAGCAAYDPQGTAQAYAPSYYNAPYSSLDPEQKMQLEDHLANQSNQAWRTTALVGSAVVVFLAVALVAGYGLRHHRVLEEAARIAQHRRVRQLAATDLDHRLAHILDRGRSDEPALLPGC